MLLMQYLIKKKGTEKNENRRIKRYAVRFSKNCSWSFDKSNNAEMNKLAIETLKLEFEIKESGKER